MDWLALSSMLLTPAWGHTIKHAAHAFLPPCLPTIKAILQLRVQAPSRVPRWPVCHRSFLRDALILLCAGSILRSQVAEVCVSALVEPAASNKVGCL